MRKIGGQLRGAVRLDLSRIGTDAQHQPRAETSAPAARDKNAIAASIARSRVAAPPVILKDGNGFVFDCNAGPTIGVDVADKSRVAHRYGFATRPSRRGVNSAAGRGSSGHFVSGEGRSAHRERVACVERNPDAAAPG